MQGNPFGAAPPPASPFAQQQQQQPTTSSGSANSMAGNPFDPMAAPAADPFGGQPQQPQQHPDYSKDPSAAGDNPFGGGAPQAATTTTPGAPYGQPQQPQQHYVAGGYPAYPQQQQSPPAPYDSALVPSTQPTNPYAVAPQDNPFGAQQQQQQQPLQTAMVPATQQSNQWGIPQHSTGSGGGGGNTFDPFAPPPPPAPAPAVTPTPVVQQPEQQVAQQPPASPVYPAQDVLPQQQAPPQEEPSYGQPPASPEPPSQHVDDGRPDPPQNNYGHEPFDSYDNNGGRPDPPVPHHSSSYQESGGRPSANDEVESGAQRNRYSQELSRRAPPGASPLPKAELVRKKGFVLSRISFRTIVMKKWKQSFWVQYGPHTMLWFRSQTDFDDWLNNPYHTQSQRNFLIKLAVNFVHDLYKPSVRGYQVTQCRTKAYGVKMIRQFKLERWMDYGPTIAAAFGSYNPKEVDDLREALVECMRNTPLNGGIRATGAVRQQNPHLQDEQHRQHAPRHTSDADNYGMHTHPPEGGDQQQQQQQQGQGQPDVQNGGSGDSGHEAEETDLLDMDNWDDVPAPGAAAAAAASPTPPQAPPYQQQQQQAPYGAAPPAGYPQQQQQQAYPPQQQQQPAGYAGAMVPAGAPQAYPGAPGGAQMYNQAAVPAYQQQPQQPQQPYGAPPSPQQQQPQQQYQAY